MYALKYAYFQYVHTPLLLFHPIHGVAICIFAA